MTTVQLQVAETAVRAVSAAPALRALSDAAIDHALADIAGRLDREARALLAANAADVDAGRARLSAAFLDRLVLDERKLSEIAAQIVTLAALPAVEPVISSVQRDGRVIETRRIPVGAIGANYEARANVTADIASQLIKSRNAGVLRTGGAALRTATSLVDHAIGPALEAVGVPAGAIGIVRTPDRAAASALVSLPALVPLVILRGSGESTAALAREAAAHGVRTLAHAEGGGVLYVHERADQALALELMERSLDRLGVCNRLNLLLIDRSLWDSFSPDAINQLRALKIEPSLPPHAHPLGYEWALDDERAATVTLAPVDSIHDAVDIANSRTSGLAASIVTADADAATEFVDAYQGTGAFWNETTRLLDGYRLFEAPETGINIDRVPGPRGPVTYRDLYLRQVVVRPACG